MPELKPIDNETADRMLAQAKLIGEAPTMNKAEADKILTNMNVNKIIAEAKPRMDNAVMESMANDRAVREPLPGPAEEIFNTEPLAVKLSNNEEVIIRPMVAFDISIFKKINSPFYRILMDDKTEGKQSLFADEEESYELVYQFTHSPKEAYQLFKKSVEVYKDKVMEEVAFKYNPADAALLVSKIMEHIFHVYLSKINYKSDESADNSAGGMDKKKLNSMPQIDTNTISSIPEVKEQAG